jgi:2,3-bisphosphoglycerate-dependent phosphoglycerate mutase
MELYFIRHAQSQNNALAASNAVDQVRTHDPELTEVGLRQAERLAEFLAQQRPDAHAAKYDPQNRRGITLTHLYASLMVRAVNTGSIVAQRLGLPLTGWIDWHEEGGLFLEETPGNFVGRPGNGRSYFAEKYPDLVLPETLTDTGWWTEALEAPEARVRRARRVLAELIARHGDSDDHVGVVSHGGFYTHLIAALMEMPAPYKLAFMLNNASVSRIVIAPQGRYVVYQNRCEFLPDELVTA